MLFKELNDQIEQLESLGLGVKIWKVPRAQNKEADRLANEAQNRLSVPMTSKEEVHEDADEGMKRRKVSDFCSVFMMSAEEVHENADAGMKKTSMEETLEEVGEEITGKIPDNEVQDEGSPEGISDDQTISASPSEPDTDVIMPDPDEETNLLQRWEPFLSDPWYGPAVQYKLLERVLPTRSGKRNTKQERKIKWEVSQLVLWDGETPKLGRYETGGDLAECIQAHQVVTILRRFHDHHGHFAAGIMSRNIVGRYY